MVTPGGLSDDAISEASAVEEKPVAYLTDADFRGCRWIKGAALPLRSGMFCGSPVVAGDSWCAEHRTVVFGERLAAR